MSNSYDQLVVALVYLTMVVAINEGCASDQLSFEGPADTADGGSDTDSSDTTAVDADALSDGHESCADEDMDGVIGTAACGGSLDCDEGDPTVFPGAVEVCNGKDDNCDGDTDEGLQNACGGCGELPNTVGQLCGACGRIICDPQDTDNTICDEGAGNICGGCGILPEVPGQPCGACGEVQCLDLNEVECVDLGANACGGCGILVGEPSTPCGDCGTWTCDDDGQSVCANDPGLNACGGCTSLTTAPDAPCGQCGTQVCDASGEGVTCVDPGLNSCNGCGLLQGMPRTPCGDCGQWACNADQTAVTCSDPGLNACQGCGVLAGTPGAVCSQCKVWTCVGVQAACQGSDPVTRYYDGDDDGVGVSNSRLTCGPEGFYRALRDGDCDDNQSNVGACTASEYCHQLTCAPLPTWNLDTAEPGCIDLGVAQQPQYTRSVWGRPNADFSQINEHTSCGTGEVPAPNDLDPLDDSGFFENSFSSGAVTDCQFSTYGAWNAWIIVDGYRSNQQTIVYYNSQCTEVATCALAATACYP